MVKTQSKASGKGRSCIMDDLSIQLETDVERLLRMQDRVGLFIDAWRDRPLVAANFVDQLEELRALERDMRATLPELATASK